MTATIIQHAGRPWSGPVVVNGKGEFTFPALPEKPRDGMRVWSVSVALANYVASLKLTGMSVELGAGCGLVGMVTGGTLVEADAETANRTWDTLQLNNSRCTLINDSWASVNGRWDNIFATEVIYQPYNPESLVECIDRCWTREGVCLIANSSEGCRHRFEDALHAHNIPHVRSVESFSGFQYFRWRLVP